MYFCLDNCPHNLQFQDMFHSVRLYIAGIFSLLSSCFKVTNENLLAILVTRIHCNLSYGKYANEFCTSDKECDRFYYLRIKSCSS